MERRFERPRFDRSSGGRFGGGGFRERDNFPKPVNEGDEYDVEINEIGTKGDGIARVKNFVIFVPDSKEGEKCRIKITMVRPKFAVAEKVGEKDIELKEPKEPVETETKEEVKPAEEEVVVDEVKEEKPKKEEKKEESKENEEKPEGESIDEDK